MQVFPEVAQRGDGSRWVGVFLNFLILHPVSSLTNIINLIIKDYVQQWTSIECLPRPQVIHFPQQRLYHGIIFPFGAMAFRCSGCCTVPMHHCVPVKVKSKIHNVFFVPYSYTVSSQRSCKL